jgi:iron complex transport system substrate-binding protein
MFECPRWLRWWLGAWALGLALPAWSATPQRIVSLLPSLTETVCALGACARLVGVDRYSNWPTSVRALPVMGGGLDPNVEAIIALQPDLILVAGSARVLPRLRELGLNVAVFEPKTHGELKAASEQIAALLGLPVERANALWQRNISQIETAKSGLPPQVLQWRLYFEVNDAPYAAGPESFIGETLSAMGLSNAVPADWGPFPRVSAEWVVAQQPDAILVGDVAAVSLTQRPGWSSLQAIKRQRLCAFSPDQADILVRPGPRLGQAAELITQCLQRLVTP